MADIFLQEDITRLLDNRFIVIIGDSIQRAVYKDLVLLLQKNRYLTEGNLRTKGEFTFCGDKLIEGGQYGEMSNGVKYREVRQYQTDYHLVRFYFVTRCYNAYVESILSDISKDPVPDVILMNSCLWDISRYGSNAVEEYKENLSTLFQRLNEVLPKTCLVIWNTTLPISKKARGGFLIPAIEFMNNTLRLDILEANFYTHKIACVNGINVLDLHYFLRHHLRRRAGDGVHWDMVAHRRMTNLILTHIAQAWNTKLPENAKKILLRVTYKVPDKREKRIFEYREQIEKSKENGGTVRAMSRYSGENSNPANANLQGNEQAYHRNSICFQQIINHISSNIEHNVRNSYNNSSVFHPPGVNMEAKSLRYEPNQSLHGRNLNTNTKRDQHFFSRNMGETLEVGPNSVQKGYIDFPKPGRDQMMVMGNHQCVSQLDWEPYRNDQLNANLRNGMGQQQREPPYSHRKRRRKYFK